MRLGPRDQSRSGEAPTSSPPGRRCLFAVPRHLWAEGSPRPAPSASPGSGTEVRNLLPAASEGKAAFNNTQGLLTHGGLRSPLPCHFIMPFLYCEFTLRRSKNEGCSLKYGSRRPDAPQGLSLPDTATPIGSSCCHNSNKVEESRSLCPWAQMTLRASSYFS